MSKRDSLNGGASFKDYYQDDTKTATGIVVGEEHVN